MKSRPSQLQAVTLLGGLLLTGCATGWHATPAKPGPKGVAKSPAAVEARAEEQEISLEKRAQAYAHFASGIVHDMRSEAELAQQEFQAAATDDPTNERLAMDVARRLLQRQQADKAVDLLTRAAAQPTASGLVQAWLGLALAQSGKLDQAIAADRLAIKRAPRLLMGYQNLAQLYFQRKQPAEGIKALDEAGRQAEVPPAYLVDLAAAYANAVRGKAAKEDEVKEKALALVARAAKQPIEEPVILERMADVYKAFGELTQASNIFNQLLKDHGQDHPELAPLLREQLIQLYLRAGDRKGAEEQLKQVLRDSPTNPQAYYLMGSLASEDKAYADAAGYFEKAILFNERLEPAYYDLAAMRLSMAQPEAALTILGKARERFQVNFLTEFYTGVAHSASKHFKEAIRAYTSAEVLGKTGDPSRINHIFYFQLGAAYERNGDFAEAEKQFRKSLELSPDYEEALNYLGYMWAERGVNLEEARTMIQKALKMDPANAAFLDSLGWVLYRLNKSAEALSYLEQAVAKSEKPDATLYDHLGDVLSALGRKQEARDAWQKSVGVEPNDQVRRKLESTP